jgi:hypothetical protein
VMVEATIGFDPYNSRKPDPTNNWDMGYFPLSPKALCSLRRQSTKDAITFVGHAPVNSQHGR